MADIITIIVSVLAAVAGFLWRKTANAKLKDIEKPTKKQKSGRKYATWLIVVALYVFVVTLITVIFGPQKPKQLTVDLAAARLNLFGLNISTSILYSWCIMLVVIVLAIIVRLALIPRLQYVPKGSQNVLEVLIETVISYTKSTAHGVGEVMGSYIFTISVFLVGCAITEMFGLRSPASDITVTAALAIITFILINFYGIKVKGLGGRLKGLAQPAAFIVPIKIITDLAVPVSLASRLFGNMLAGLVVIDLLYTALGNFSVGIPSVLGLFFNVFHPLLQAYIFVTLTLSFINEVTE